MLAQITEVSEASKSRYALSARVTSLIHPDNAPSRRVAEKLGEKIEGETEVLTMPVLVYAARR